MQFKAGYIADSIAKVIIDFKAKLNKNNVSEQNKLLQIDGLLQYVSSFEVKFPHEQKVDFHEINPVLASINNIITRGLPTRLPVSIEKEFSKIGLTEANKDEYEFNFPIAVKKIEFETIFRLLHILEPKLEISKSQYAGFPGSLAEWKFLDETLKDFPFAKQILQSQRDFSTIGTGLAGGKTVDFSFEFPYQTPKKTGSLTDKQKKGIIFEFDGPHHKRQDIKYYDKYRDDVADENNFETLRQASDLSLNPSIGDNFKEDIFKIFETNYHRNFKEYLEEYSLLFIPLAVARIQKTIIELFLRNKDLLKKETLSVAIIERDLPCGAIAIKSIQDYFENINAILEDKDKLILPKIDLTIFENKNWVTDNEIHLNASIKNEEYFKLTNFDIVIDHSILRRSDIYNEIDFYCDNAIKIRSSHYFDTNNGRIIYCANLLNYKSLVLKKDDGSYIQINEYEENINFFIQNIFRKAGFRDGQLPIISRALQQKPVIGLLPTGGGKSLTFQLPTFLQPGLCLVVDPIKSLMEDQVRVLKENWIDCCDFINSNDKRQDKAKKLIDFRFGETMFLFVSPERFVMEDFRSIIKNIGTSKFGLAFSYCVIDEVHCVSEWGHDFRTTYLMLGKNAQYFAATKNQNPVSLIGLTATASFDVLTDIERELKINADDSHDAIISIDNTIRPELFFCLFENTVIPTTFPVKEQELKDTIGFGKQTDLNSFYGNILNELSKIDSGAITEGIEQHYNDFEILENSNQKEIDKKKEEAFQKINKSFVYEDKNSVVSIVFMPHITGSYGITQEANPFPNGKELFENLTNIPTQNKGYFMGGDDKVLNIAIKNAQQYFLDFMDGNNQTNTMICTKAFGMGIDKENIRAVNHFNFSSSPESYIQEAGRAGRDKAKAICTIFIDRNIFYSAKNDLIKSNPQLFNLIKDRKTLRSKFEVYDDFQNRIQKIYYKTKLDLIGALGVEIDEKYIEKFNQDKSIHDFFHQNSFKGIETEMFQLVRFFEYNDGINTTQIKISEEQFNDTFNENTHFYLTPNGVHMGNLWIRENNKPIGKIITNTATPTSTILGLGADATPNLEKTNEILVFLKTEWELGKIGTTLFDFLNRPIVLGLNEGYSFQDYYQIKEKAKQTNFRFQTPAKYNKREIELSILNDFALQNLNIRANSLDFLKTLKNKSSDFDDFILRVEEEWSINLIGTPTYETNKAKYKYLYYSDVNNLDVSRMIYRLNSVGVIDDYTIDYNLGIYTLNVVIRDKEEYIIHTENHLLKYLSRASTIKKISKLRDETKDFDTFKTIQKCVKRILKFTYKDIVEKRKGAANELYNYIELGIEESNQKGESHFNLKLKDELYYYFNAKYARTGYKIGGEDYSLMDDTVKGQISDWVHFKKYAEMLNDQSRFINECKMMRGSCKRIWRSLSNEDYKEEFTLKILYAYATFGLNNRLYYEEAEKFLIEGFDIYYNQTNDYLLLKEKLAQFEKLIAQSAKNPQLKPYLHSVKHNIMLKVNLRFTSETIKQLLEK